jgi:fructoselysine-6-P-deglycase FrlB-like protein
VDPTPGGVVVAISASGGSAETLDAVDRLAEDTRVTALTNRLESSLAARVDNAVDLVAGPEAGGVASVSFLHTLVLLLALEARLTGGSRAEVAALCLRAADGTEALLESRSEWLPTVDDLLDGPDGVYVLAPIERWSSGAQSALMLREGPRVPADACETADWAHVDVYLTKTRDYRSIVLGGSAYDAQAMDWMRQREATVVAVGGLLDSEVPRHVVRYPGDTDPEVALLTEVTVAEVLAARWWAR